MCKDKQLMFQQSSAIEKKSKNYSSKKDKRKNKPIKNQKNLGPIPNIKNTIAIPRKGLLPLL